MTVLWWTLCVQIILAVSFSTTDAQEVSVPVRPDSMAVQHSTELVPPAITWHGMITNVPGDWVSAGQVTTRLTSVPSLLTIAACTGALMAIDRPLYKNSRLLQDRNPWLRSASDFFVHAGDGKTHLGVAASFLLYGVIASDSRACRTASQTVESLLACGIAVQVLKRIAGRESPEAATDGRGAWHPFPNLRQYQRHQTRYYAFPSGHISTTMAVVTVIAENYPEATWIRPVGYALVGCLGVSLVNVRYHWYSDLPLGIALGHMFGKIVAGGMENKEKESDHARVSLTPAILPRGTGITLAMQF